MQSVYSFCLNFLSRENITQFLIRKSELLSSLVGQPVTHRIGGFVIQHFFVPQCNTRRKGEAVSVFRIDEIQPVDIFKHPDKAALEIVVLESRNDCSDGTQNSTEPSAESVLRTTGSGGFQTAYAGSHSSVDGDLHARP